MPFRACHPGAKSQPLYSKQAMATSSPRSSVDGLTNRRFSFYPAIRNIEHNEWRLKEETWAEVLVANVETGQEIWVPRTYLGEISSSDSPVLIMGLNQELEWKAGKVWPYQERIIRMPEPTGTQRGRTGEPTPGPTVPTGARSPAERHMGRFIAGAVVAGLVACLFVILYAFDGLQNPLRLLFPADMRTTDQRYLALAAADGHHEVVSKTGAPASDEWITPADAEIQFALLSYPDRSYALVMMGADRKETRYIGAIHIPSRKTLDTVKLSGGGTTAAMLRNLPDF